MHFTRIEVQGFRKLVQPHCLDGLTPGLNVIGGDNEEGKSTLLAALKHAFFQHHKVSGEVRRRMLPHAGATAPLVVLDFVIGGTGFRLTKAFRTDGVRLEEGARCWSNEEVEEKLRSMLDFERPGRATKELKPAHTGLAGLFWIEQGRSFEAVETTPGDLRRLTPLLDREIGHVVDGGLADRVADAVATEMPKFWTRTLRETGALSAARQALEESESALAEWRTKAAAHEERLQRLQRLRAERKRVQDEDLEGQAVSRREALRKAVDELIRREQERRVVGEQLALARARYEKLQERTTARSRRTNEAEAFRTKLERLNEERLEIEARIERQTRLLEGARARAAAARAEAETAHRGLRRAWRSKEATAARLEVVKLEQLTEEMRYRETRIERLRHERALNPLTEDALRELRRRVDARDKAREASAVSATRLDLRPETGRKARLDGLDCTADEPLYLVDTTEITLEGWGRVRVTPGGTDVADRRKTLEEAEHALADMLERNGTTDLDAAETRAAERREVETVLQRLEAERTALLTAAGLKTADALQPSLDAAREDAARATDGTDADDDAAPLDPAGLQRAADEADARVAETRDAVEAAEKTLSADRERSAVCRTRIEDAEAGAVSVAGRIREDLEEMDDETLARRLADEEAAWKERREAAADLDRTLEAPDTLMLRDKLAIAEAGLDELIAERRRRDNDILALRSELRALGSEGVGEALETRRQQCEAARRTFDAVTLEAAAWKLLDETLTAERRRLRDRYMQPIRSRLEPHLRLLLDETKAVLDSEAIALTHLVRGDAEEAYDDLSLGTREQVAVLVRLAFAELMADQGADLPPLILDDALVYADEERFETMKAILKRAAERQQIVILTCRPRDYVGLGAYTLRLRDCRRTAD